MSRHLPESDWKKFRKIRTIALERFCERVLKDIVRLASDDVRSCHDRYLEIFRLIDERDDELARAFNDARRSQAIFQLGLIHKYGLLEPGELASFTEETREAIESIFGRA
jgi:hypothetical protein